MKWQTVRHNTSELYIVVLFLPISAFYRVWCRYWYIPANQLQHYCCYQRSPGHTLGLRVSGWTWGGRSRPQVCSGFYCVCYDSMFQGTYLLVPFWFLLVVYIFFVTWFHVAVLVLWWPMYFLFCLVDFDVSIFFLDMCLYFVFGEWFVVTIVVFFQA